MADVWVDATCAICMEDMGAESVEADLKVLSCGHRFHAKCVTTWLAVKSDCPTCRTLQAPLPSRPMAERAVAVRAEDGEQSMSDGTETVPLRPFDRMHNNFAVAFLLLWLFVNPFMCLWTVGTLGRHTRVTALLHSSLGVFLLCNSSTFLVSPTPCFIVTGAMIAYVVQVGLWNWLLKRER